MSTLYLVTGTFILNDQIFSKYGGDPGSSTLEQREAAYMLAEQQAIEEIGTFLIPTQITENFSMPTQRIQGACRVQLHYNRLISIDSLTAKHEIYCNCTTVDLTGCALIVHAENSVIDMQYCGGASGGAQCNCAWAQGYSPYNLPRLVQITYTAGIPTGQGAITPTVLMGLTAAAKLALEQIIDPSGAEGGPGDPQVNSFSDTGYSETRGGLRMTAFGGSPQANFAARMLAPLKYKGVLRIG